jgi:hypothetical protein
MCREFGRCVESLGDDEYHDVLLQQTTKQKQPALWDHLARISESYISSLSPFFRI